MIINFNEISVLGFKAGKCSVCGKRAARQKKFYQTINPFNLNSKGNVKSREEIYKEILKKRKEWLEQPICHLKCGNK